jgi:hypothetical protein
MADDSTTASDARTSPASEVGRKFNTDGTVRPFAGNTFIGHLPQQEEGFDTFNAVLSAYRDLPRHPVAGKLIALPPSSYHITAFVGVNDQDRSGGAWPAWASRDIPIAPITQTIKQRLQVLPFSAPFAFRAADPDTHPLGGSVGIPMQPIDDATKHRLAALRDTLAEITGLRRADHESYRFHLSIAYLREALRADERAELDQARRIWARSINAAGPVVISSVAFCSFEDMFAFRELRRV